MEYPAQRSEVVPGVDGSDLSVCWWLAQVATKAGVVNIPQWYDAGSVWVQNNPNFPFGAPQPHNIPSALYKPLYRAEFSTRSIIHS